MSADGPDTERCTLCGGELPDANRGSFCCEGCRRIHEELEPAGGVPEREFRSDETDHATEGSDLERTFLRVDGMHSVTCEEFLESRAEGIGGVAAAAASYVTETVRIDHDAEVAAPELRDALSTLGYTAYLRDEAAGGETSGTTRRSREMQGIRKRRSDEILGMRYAAGVLFAAFLLVPYVVLVYPAHLADLVGGPFSLYEGTLRLEGAAGLLFLRIYLALAGIVLFFTGMPVLRGAYASLRTRRFNTDLLVAVAIVGAFAYSTAAVLLGRNDVYFDLTVVIAAAVTAASFYETSIKQRALERLTDLTVSQVDEARRYEPGGTTTVPIEEIDPGDRLLVREGERIPVDGTVERHECTVEEAVVTGESLPVRKTPGDEVVGGSVLTDGAAVIAVGEERSSTIDRIRTAVWNLQSADHGVQRRADRLAALAVPMVGAVAVLAAVASFSIGGGPDGALLAGLAALLVASPWALGLATPLSIAESLRAAMDRGIVVLDESIFERLRGVDAIVFDKTGTLTTGEMEVLAADAPGDLLEAVAAIERRASHPVARAIVAAHAGEAEPVAEPDGGRSERVAAFRSHATGVEGTVDGTRVLAGTPSLFAERGWTVDDEIERRSVEARGVGRLPVVVGRDGRAEGTIVVGDEPRAEWAEVATRLDERGMDVVVLTGDDEEAADFLAAHPAVDRVFAGVPPAGKAAAVRRLAADREVAMVGDGTNDAPALAVADLGIALGGGTALAADAAEVAIDGDDLTAVEETFELAEAADRRLRTTVALGLSYNAVAIPLALAGLLNPVTAMAAVLVGGGLVGINAARSY